MNALIFLNNLLNPLDQVRSAWSIKLILDVQGLINDDASLDERQQKTVTEILSRKCDMQPSVWEFAAFINSCH